jgi:GGDEF domain-containing protein
MVQWRVVHEGFTRITSGDFSLSVTIGIAAYPRDGRNARDLILSADRALLDAKKMKYTTSIGCSRPVAVA